MAINAYGQAIRLAALRSDKAQQWLKGRKNWRYEAQRIRQSDQACILLHAASLGELEQGIPILKALRKSHPQHQIIVSFFSPSGYQHFEPGPLCDGKIYLPLDRKKDAKDFAAILQPELSLFIKYEVWPNLIEALKEVGSKLVLAPAIFREHQIYFRNIRGNIFLKALQQFDHIAVQDTFSLKLLAKQGLRQTSICGDSRFDRAWENKLQKYSGPDLSGFKEQADYCLIAGSCWPPEEKLVEQLLSEKPKFRLILAPHDVSAANLKRLTEQFEKFGLLKLSEATPANTNSGRVILVDGIGQLKYLYRFADLALIGGGFGKGLHNSIEAAVYQIPLLFGPKNQKFPEAREMKDLGIARDVPSYESFKSAIDFFKSKNQNELKANIGNYVKARQGAALKIVHEIERLLKDGH